MTVTVTSTIEGPLTPNGVAITFGFPFKVISGAEVEVYRGEPDAWTLVDDALYSVTLNDGEGGQVVFTTPPATGSGPLYIVSAPSFQQQGGFAGGEVPFTPVSVSQLLDQAAIRSLVLKAGVDRALKTAPGEGGLEVGDIANGQVLAKVGGRIVGVENDPASAAGSAAAAAASAAAALVTKDEVGDIAEDVAEDREDTIQAKEDAQEAAAVRSPMEIGHDCFCTGGARGCSRAGKDPHLCRVAPAADRRRLVRARCVG